MVGYRLFNGTERVRFLSAALWYDESMMHDTCPHCGHRKEPYLMARSDEETSLTEMWSGEGHPWQRLLLRGAAIAVVFILLLLYFLATNMPS